MGFFSTKDLQPIENLGAGGGSRTLTGLRPEDFKSSAYTISPPRLYGVLAHRKPTSGKVSTGSAKDRKAPR